ncbi:hypothetical protein HMPREF9413_4690 [Paenibacillus sp. HGF7]|nr:hypothetical protein HMPREF9413_4690 [Paenibacillus sp. HGF7]
MRRMVVEGDKAWKPWLRWLISSLYLLLGIVSLALGLWLF